MGVGLDSARMLPEASKAAAVRDVIDIWAGQV